jgi:hypothetical protein
VDRPLVSTQTKEDQKRLLEGRDQDEIKTALDGANSAPFLERLSAFIEFAEQFRPNSLEKPWWVSLRGVGDVRLAFMGFCTSWMSYHDDEQGHLLVGRFQLHRLLQEARPADFKIALMHHPFQSLKDFDMAETEDCITRDCELVLWGHGHKQGTGMLQADRGSLLRMAAGSSYGRSDHLNAFALTEIWPSRRSVKMHAHLWDKGEWIPDKNLWQDTSDGTRTWDLPIHASGPPSEEGLARIGVMPHERRRIEEPVPVSMNSGTLDVSAASSEPAPITLGLRSVIEGLEERMLLDLKTVVSGLQDLEGRRA